MEHRAPFQSTNEITSERDSMTAVALTLPGICDSSNRGTEIDSEASLVSFDAVGGGNVTDNSGNNSANSALVRTSCMLVAPGAEMTSTQYAAEENETTEVTEKDDENDKDDKGDEDKIETAREVALCITKLYEETLGKIHGLAPVPEDVVNEWNLLKKEWFKTMEFVIELEPAGPSHLVLRRDISKYLKALLEIDSSIIRAMDKFSCVEGVVGFGETVTVNEGGLSAAVLGTLFNVKSLMTKCFLHANIVNETVFKEMKVPEDFIATVPKHARMIIQKNLWEGLRKWPSFSIIDFMKDENKNDLVSAKTMLTDLEKVWVIWDGKMRSESFLSSLRDAWSNRNWALRSAISRCTYSIRKIKEEFPTIGHTELETQKIRKCSHTGLSGIEAYSKALKSHCVMILARIDETIDAHNAAVSVRG